MLLETLDIKKNDVLIYSENKFDFEHNFKIIDKQSVSKVPCTIKFSEIGNYINYPAPKNLIVYRLLTNLFEFNAELTKYGFIIFIHNKSELIYYDPVYAVKELEALNDYIDFDLFRFKIQQIGLTYSGIYNNCAVFSEVYSFDLKAIEAQNQNDKVFAEAIFAFNDKVQNKSSKQYFPSEKTSINIIEKADTSKKEEKEVLLLKLIEDKKNDSKSFNKPEIQPIVLNSDVNKIDYSEYFSKKPFNFDKLKTSQTKESETSGNQNQKEKRVEIDPRKKDLLTAFKSTTDLNSFLNKREPVVLKIK